MTDVNELDNASPQESIRENVGPFAAFYSVGVRNTQGKTVRYSCWLKRPRIFEKDEKGNIKRETTNNRSHPVIDKVEQAKMDAEIRDAINAITTKYGAELYAETIIPEVLYNDQNLRLFGGANPFFHSKIRRFAESKKLAERAAKVEEAKAEEGVQF